jgi:diguanylate cyclase (GGDEF)-like protein
MPATIDRPRTVSLLLVEDSGTDALMIEHMLDESSDEEFGLVHVGAVADARRALNELEPDCVLLDLGLPDVNGLEGLMDLRVAAPGVPIVILSGRADEGLAVEAVRAGAQDYLIKGRVDADVLTRSIHHSIERKRIESKLSHLALRDSLTGLPNRSVFIDHLRHALARLERHGSSVAVLFLDLDHFKPINDSLGHEAGDRLLVELAARLMEVMRPSDTVARYGGDEFIVLCEDIEDERDAYGIADRITVVVTDPFHVADTEVSVAPSIGLSMTSQPQKSPEELIREADEAMYGAKRRGRSLGAAPFTTQPADETLREAGFLLADVLTDKDPANGSEPPDQEEDSERGASGLLHRWRRSPGS